MASYHKLDHMQDFLTIFGYSLLNIICYIKDWFARSGTARPRRALDSLHLPASADCSASFSMTWVGMGVCPRQREWLQHKPRAQVAKSLPPIRLVALWGAPSSFSSFSKVVCVVKLFGFYVYFPGT